MDLLGVYLPRIQPRILDIFLQDGQCVRQCAKSLRADTKDEGDWVDVN